jgi:hypothetical protein
MTYVLADQEVRLLKSKLRLRQITRLMDNGHQTPILTSRRDLPRWRREGIGSRQEKPRGQGWPKGRNALSELSG